MSRRMLIAAAATAAATAGVAAGCGGGASGVDAASTSSATTAAEGVAPLAAQTPAAEGVVLTQSDPVGTLYSVVLPSDEALAWARERARPRRLLCHGTASGASTVCDSPDGTTHAFINVNGDGTSLVQVSLPPG